MSTPPPPIQSNGDRCPNCGSYLPAGQGYCANCGYGSQNLASPPASSSAWIVWLVLLILIGIPAGCFGGCILLLGGASPDMRSDPWFYVISVGGLGIFLLLIFLVFRSVSRRNK